MIAEQGDAAVARQSRIAMCRRGFWYYCLYTDSMTYNVLHLQKLCMILNAIYYGLPIDATGKIYRKIVLSLPPRHWKTRTLIHFCAWALGKDQTHRIIAATYNENEATDYGKFTRDEIGREKNLPEEIVFGDVFKQESGEFEGHPVRLKHGDQGKRKWALQGEHFNFLSTSPHGSLTGKGGTIKVLDDLVKDAEKAMNEVHLDGLFTWYVSTFASRTEGKDGGEPIEIVCSTRWSKRDMSGRLLTEEPGDWYEYKLEVYDGHRMLCAEMLTKKAYLRIKTLARRNDNPVSWALFQANYHQLIIAVEGCLYTNIKTYDSNEIPQAIEARACYADVADEGKDYLCAIFYLVAGKLAYVIDVVYTQANAEVTEPMMADAFVRNRILQSNFESQAGGKHYARNISRLLDEYEYEDDTGQPRVGYDCKVSWFHQSENKMSRIATKSNNVIDGVLMPHNWIHLWPEFANALLNFNTKISGQPDDCADAITGVFEYTKRGMTWG